MTAVVTGATGQAGRALVDALLSAGRPVRALVLPGDRGLAGVAGVEVVEGDVTAPADLRAAFAGADSVFHLAAVVSTADRPGPHLEQVNVDGARNAAQAARQAGVRRFVHFSSIAVFDPQPRDQPLDETRPRLPEERAGAYARSKIRGEAAVRREVDLGLHAVVVHPTVIVGPHETHHDGIVRGLIGQHWAGRLPAVTGGAFDLVDVCDVARGAILAEAHGRAGESYLLAGRRYTVRELLEVCAAASGRPLPRLAVSWSVARAALPLVTAAARVTGLRPPYDRESLAQLRYPPIAWAKAARELGYEPRPIDDAVRRVHRWLDDAGAR
ncbi:MAG: NAD-dependent epimerase/dehydratase family protein [Sandaracinaceae bacterium]